MAAAQPRPAIFHVFEAATNVILYPISEQTLKEKISKADPVIRAILRSLLLRLNDINTKSEEFWRSLNVMASLSEEEKEK